MKNAKTTISKKIVLLNQTTLDSMMGRDNITIIKNFTEAGIKILEADFGFAWWKFLNNEKYQLAYKSPSTPYEPTIPRESAGNYIARTTKKPFFDSEVKKKNYVFDISRYLKSYIIIPIYYNEFTYGNLVLCYKKNHFFTENEIDLATILGTTTAQTITIYRLIASEREARAYSEKQGAHFKALIENINEVIIHVGDNGKVLYVSPSAGKILGGDVKKMVGKNISKVLYSEKGKKKNYLEKILKEKNKSSVTEFSYKKDGSIIFFESISSRMAGDAGGMVLNIRDVTERKKLESMKESARLLKEEQFKAQSIADASHELRTPLAIIKGTIDLAMQMRHKNANAPISALRSIDYEIKHLSGILSDLTLLTSPKDQLKKNASYGKVNIKSVVAGVAERLKILAHEKKISIKVKRMPAITFLGNEAYLERMLVNLVENSIKYGNQNGRTVIDAVKSKDSVKISISDDGIGIPKEDLPYIFERFYRADKSHNSLGNSTGLGLAVVKWIAEIHGGTVSARSVKGIGTVFSVSLPIKTIK